MKILIICSEPFNYVSATGITLSSIFRVFPKNDIACVFSANIQPSFDICSNYYKLNVLGRNILWYNHIGTIKDTMHVSCMDSRNGKVTKIKTQIKTVVNDWIDLFSIKIDADLENWIQQFSPDVIYSLSGNIQITQLVNRLAEKYDLPVIPHFMDDWMSTIYSKKYLCIQNIYLKYVIKKMMRLSPIAFAISPQMALEYSHKFSKEFIPLMNCPKQIVEEPVFSGKDGLLISYVGGLHLNRWQSIKILADHLDHLNKEGIQIKLEIYTNSNIENIKYLLTNQYVIFKNPVKADEVDGLLLQSDLLLHIESFVPEDINYTRLSISTKIPQYVSVGKPIIGIGSFRCASIQCLEESNAALVFTEKNLSTINEKLTYLYTHRELLHEMSLNAIKYAENHFNSERQMNLFKDKIAEYAK